MARVFVITGPSGVGKGTLFRRFGSRVSWLEARTGNLVAAAEVAEEALSFAAATGAEATGAWAVRSGEQAEVICLRCARTTAGLNRAALDRKTQRVRRRVPPQWNT